MIKRSIVNERGRKIDFTIDISERGVYISAVSPVIEHTDLWTRVEAETLHTMLGEALAQSQDKILCNFNPEIGRGFTG